MQSGMDPTKSAYGGLFKDPPYISTDANAAKTDLYLKTDTIPSRYLGKSMLTSHVPPGNLPESFFDGKYLSLASAEQNGARAANVYENPEKAALRDAAESKKKNIDPHPFRYTGPAATNSGSGDYYGSFQRTPYEHTPSGPAGGESSKEEGDGTAASARHVFALPNMKTNPSKKGTYGYPGLLLEKQSYDESWKAADSKGNGSGAGAAAAASKAAAGERKQPFKIALTSKGCLDSKPATGVSSVYDSTGSSADAAKAKKTDEKPKESGAGFAQAKPFMFSTRTHQGEQGYLDKFPNKWVNADEIASAKPAKQRRLGGNGGAAGGANPNEAKKPIGGAWKPTSSNSTSVVQSCLRRFY